MSDLVVPRHFGYTQTSKLQNPPGGMGDTVSGNQSHSLLAAKNIELFGKE